MSRDELRFDSHGRRRGTIDPNQLTLLEEGAIGYAYACSINLANPSGAVIDLKTQSRVYSLTNA